MPFFFIYSPAMLLLDSTALQIIWAAISGLIGTYFLSIAIEGYFMMELPVWLRPVFFVAAIALIAPGITTDLLGTGLAVDRLHLCIRGQADPKGRDRIRDRRRGLSPACDNCSQKS